ncbi:hypothetical protein [uncultured Roseobacter sp.]|uniref:hypothetical protein n=1 Tax=uncultured Roseobacter sp. TaxID=114847 RepID=UPI00261192C5|nr:hypothetical protein [uncultured Roseobacter sp.]
MRDKLLEALPIFIGALLGVYFLNTPFPGVLVTLVFLAFVIVGFTARASAMALLATHPKKAVQMWQFQMLTPVALIGAFSYLGGWALSELPGVLPHIPGLEMPPPPEGSEKPDYKSIASPLATAAATFFGSLFMDDLQKGKGGYWPPAQIKAGFKDRFGPKVVALRKTFEPKENETTASLRMRLKQDLDGLSAYEQVKRAVYEDKISDEHPEGWGFSAVRARADIVTTAFLAKSEATA